MTANDGASPAARPGARLRVARSPARHGEPAEVGDTAREDDLAYASYSYVCV
ncbi:MAG: hypothetical protein ABSG93_14215 [Solirubrobacteraceae bacterium]